MLVPPWPLAHSLNASQAKHGRLDVQQMHTYLCHYVPILQSESKVPTKYDFSPNLSGIEGCYVAVQLTEYGVQALSQAFCPRATCRWHSHASVSSNPSTIMLIIAGPGNATEAVQGRVWWRHHICPVARHGAKTCSKHSSPLASHRGKNSGERGNDGHAHSSTEIPSPLSPT